MDNTNTARNARRQKASTAERISEKNEKQVSEKSRLEKALDVASTMQTFNLGKTTLKVKTQNLLSYSFNGGMFKVDQSLISFVNYISQTGRTEVVILDKNDVPVKITDIPTFLDDISSLYFEVINDYYNEYQKLKSSRNIEKVLEI